MGNLNNIPKLRFPGFIDEWKEKKVGELCDFIVPGRNKPTNFIGNIPWITTPDIQHNGIVLYSKKELAISKDEAKKVGSKIVPQNAIIMSCVGDIGLVAIAGTEMVINQQLHAFIPQTVEYRFLLYSLGNQKKYMEKVATKTAVPYMNKDNCNSIPITYPTLPEQQKIANFLTVVDEKLQALKKKKSLLEDYKKGIMQKLFSQELRFKDENGMEFPDWKEMKLSEVLIKNSVKNKGQKYSIVQSVSNKHGFINQDEMFEDRRIASKDTSNYYVIEKGHFAYNPSRIDVGSLAYKYDDEISVISPLYISFKSNKEYLKDSFLLSWFSSEEFMRQMNSSFEGSVRNTLSYESLIKMDIFIPNNEEQIKISTFIKEIDERIRVSEVQIEKMETWKRGLLQKMFV